MVRTGSASQRSNHGERAPRSGGRARAAIQNLGDGMTRAFDLALFVGTPANVNDASVVSTVGPPFTTAFKSVALSSKPGGVTVQADVPQALKAGQIMLSGAGPSFAWGLIDNPAAAASVPPPLEQFDIVLADATPAWRTTPFGSALGAAGAVLNSTGASFSPTSNVVFAPTVAATKRLDGGDPNFSLLDNFSFDMGQF